MLLENPILNNQYANFDCKSFHCQINNIKSKQNEEFLNTKSLNINKIDLTLFKDVELWCKQRSQYLFVQKALEKHIIINENDQQIEKRRFKELYLEKWSDPISKNLKIRTFLYSHNSGIRYISNSSYIVCELQDQYGNRYSSPVVLPYNAKHASTIIRYWFHQRFQIYKDFAIDFLNSFQCDYKRETSQGWIWFDYYFQIKNINKEQLNVIDHDPQEFIPICFSKYMDDNVPDIFFIPYEIYYSTKKFIPCEKLHVEKLEDIQDDGIGIKIRKTQIRRIDYQSKFSQIKTFERISDFQEKQIYSVSYHTKFFNQLTNNPLIRSENLNSNDHEGQKEENETNNQNKNEFDLYLNVNSENQATMTIVKEGKQEETSDFYGYKAGYCNIGEAQFPCIIKLYVPSDAKVAFSNEGPKLRVDKAKVIAILPFVYNFEKYEHKDELLKSDVFDIKWSNLEYFDLSERYLGTIFDENPHFYSLQHAFGWKFATFKYELYGEIQIDNFDKDLNKTCVPGIHLFPTQSDAFEMHGIFGVNPFLVKGYDAMESFVLKE